MSKLKQALLFHLLNFTVKMVKKHSKNGYRYIYGPGMKPIAVQLTISRELLFEGVLEAWDD